MIEYLLIISIGLIVYSIVNYVLLNRININKIDIIIINILEISSIFLGSKILDIIVYYNEYVNYDLKKIIFIGFMINGGIILRIIVIYLYSIIRNINIKKLFNILIPNILLMYSILKIGCFINGCCMGIHNIPLPIIESVIYFIIYIIIIKLNNKIEISCISFGMLRLLSFLIREDITNNSLIINTIISIVLIIIGLFIIYKDKRFYV